MNFDRLLSTVERRRKTIVVYSSDDDDVADGFEVRNASVEHRRLPDGAAGFAVVRGRDGFAGAIGLGELEEFVEPPIYSPWDEAFLTAEYRTLFELLDDSLFASLDRRQLLAATREIENRAWRVGRGTLRVGFQRLSILETQIDFYARLGAETALDVHVYGRDDWDPLEIPNTTVHAEPGDEIGSFWFLAFDGGDDETQACALLAKERAPGKFSGFWTYDPQIVDEMMTYVRNTYD
ncbi:DICT sensory domain-containing protein [Natribaculum luteum]|uniref:DICT sensory domain-containing protein n=1 Tax=Natribaculum luteum TaxID=1586232 RepID=A0ABD5NY41_9EURY|nr:DICT sensory domain-containing protein [Natribaculum luteum]